MKDLSDISLVSRVTVLHDRRAFDSLVRKYQSPIRRFFLNQTLGDGQLSDDLAQDTFIKAYVSIAQFRALSSFSTWLFRIAYNVFYDYVRRCHPSDDFDAALMKADRGTSGGGESERIDIFEALRKLCCNERICVTLQLVEGYKINEIAKITGLAEGTVKSHLFRGKEKLSRYLKHNGYDRKGH